jgi:hypothetical protein
MQGHTRKFEEIHSHIWTTKVHYHVHNSPQMVIILNHINQVHSLLNDFFNIHVLSSSGLQISLPCCPLSLSFSTIIAYSVGQITWRSLKFKNQLAC